MASVKKIGVHWIADFQGVSSRKLANAAKLMSVLETSVQKAGFKSITSSYSHKFDTGGKGVTGFVLLAQSHAAFHSYPEFDYMALDIYSCGRQDAHVVLEAFKKHLQPKKYKLRKMNRS